MIEKSPSTTAARANPRVALVTCAELPDLDPDDRLLCPLLAARDIAAEPAVWDDARVDWSRYDLAVLRSPWDYVTRRDAFITWATRVPALANPAEVVAWNTDKTYLASLAGRGLPVVPTRWVGPDAPWTPPRDGQVVVKPAVSAGSLDTGRYDLASAAQRDLAGAHVERLRAAGRLVMVQPYLSAVDSYGETALLFLGGRYSHAVRKGPMLDGPDPGFAGLYRPEQITARTATPDELALAERVLAGVPGGAQRLLYARVDVIPDDRGRPLLVELELTEPSLFLGWADGAADRFAEAIATRLAEATTTRPGRPTTPRLAEATSARLPAVRSARAGAGQPGR